MANFYASNKSLKERKKIPDEKFPNKNRRGVVGGAENKFQLKVPSFQLTQGLDKLCDSGTNLQGCGQEMEKRREEAKLKVIKFKGNAENSQWR
jgi:hypothetical protein